MAAVLMRMPVTARLGALVLLGAGINRFGIDAFIPPGSGPPAQLQIDGSGDRLGVSPQ